MSEGKWQRREISPVQVMKIIREYGAPTTSEIKWILRTDTQSIRKPLAILWGHNKIFPFPAFGGLVFIEVDGKRGRPNPLKLREARGHKAPRQEKVAARVRQGSTVTESAVRLPDAANSNTQSRTRVKKGRIVVDMDEQW